MTGLYCRVSSSAQLREVANELEREVAEATMVTEHRGEGDGSLSVAKEETADVF